MFRHYIVLTSVLLTTFAIMFTNNSIYADTLPPGATIISSSGVPDQYTGKMFTNPGPQTWTAPNPQGLVTSIWISSAPNVQSPVLYFDVGSTTYQVTIIGSTNMLINFASPTVVSNVYVQIAGRTTPSDGLGVGYNYDSLPLTSPPGSTSPLPANVITSVGLHSNELHSWVYRTPGPQIHSYPDPQGPVNAIYTSVTTYVSNAFLYFDANGNTYSVQVFPNSNIVLNFPSPTVLSNVKIGISERGYLDDAGNVSYFVDGSFPQPPQSPSQAIGQVSIQGTCGLSFPDGNSVNYGSLIPNSISPQVKLNMTNTGTVPATLQVSGSDWLDGSSNPQMFVNRTHYNVTSGTYVQKAPLQSFDQLVTPSFIPAVILQTYWQLQAILMNPSFTGTTTQTMDLVVSC